MKKLYFLMLALLVGAVTAMAAPDLYLRGAISGNDWPALEKYKFTQDGDVYTLSLDKLNGEFKIADKTWDIANYGLPTEGVVELDKDYTLIEEGKNCGTGSNTFTDITITFNISTRVMHITGNAQEAVVSYALNGQFTNSSWSETPLTEKDGKWVATVAPTVPAGKFGVKMLTGGTQSGYWKGGETLTEENPTITLSKSAANDASYSLVGGKDYNFSFDPATGELAISFEQGGEVTYPETLYVIGNVKSGKFQANNTLALTTTETPGLYTGEVTFTGADGTAFSYFQFCTATGSSADDWGGLGTRYGAPVKDAVPGEEPSEITFNDNSWKVANATYTVTVDLAAMTVSVKGKGGDNPDEPLKFGIVGTMQTTAWDIDNPIEMTEADGVFTLSFDALKAGTLFKVATIGKKWDDTFGAESASAEATNVELTLGKAANAWKTSSHNFMVANDLTNATITFTYIENSVSTVMVEGTEVVIDEPLKFGIVGSMQATAWDVENPIEMTEADGVYTLSLDAIEAGATFKVATIGKGWDNTFGAESESTEAADVELTLGAAANAWEGSSHNFKVVNALTDATITFTYVKDGPSTVMVEGTEAVNPDKPKTIEATYDFEAIAAGYPEEEWVADGTTGNKMIIISDKTFEANGFSLLFKKNEATTDVRLYKSNVTSVRAYANSIITLTAPTGYDIDQVEMWSKETKSKSLFSALEADGWSMADMTELPEGSKSGVIFTPSTREGGNNSILFNVKGKPRIGYIKVKATETTLGVEEVSNEDFNAPVEYYNLQGVRVVNPSTGIYIRRQGSTVTKVLVK